MNRKDIRVLHVSFVLLIAIAMPACFGRSDVADVTINPPSKPVLVDPVKPGSLADKDQQIAKAEGELARMRAERETLSLAPLRTSLAWAEGLSLLGFVACVGLAVAACFWGLGFAWKIPAGLALCFAGILVACLFASFALSHVGWIVGGVLTLLALAALWAARKHLSLVGAAREAWGHVPESAATSAHVDALMDRLTK